jgi:hypothetical protein
LYRSETFPLTSRKEHRRNVFEKRELKRKSETKGDELIEGKEKCA